MSRYIVIPVIRREQATHKSVSSPGALFRVFDTTVRNVESDAPRVDDISDLEVLQTPPKVTPTPQEIPLWAFRQVLIEDGLLTQIKSYINSLETGVSASLNNFIEYGNYVTRKSPALKSIATAIGKTDADIDALFVRASKLKL